MSFLSCFCVICVIFSYFLLFLSNSSYPFIRLVKLTSASLAELARETAAMEQQLSDAISIMSTSLSAAAESTEATLNTLLMFYSYVLDELDTLGAGVECCSVQLVGSAGLAGSGNIGAQVVVPAAFFVLSVFVLVGMGVKYWNAE